MDDSGEKVEDSNEEHEIPNPLEQLDPLSLKLLRCSTWLMTIQTITFALIILLVINSVIFDQEVKEQGFIVAVVLHTVACVVATVVIEWNNQETLTLHLIKKGYEFWSINFMLSSKSITNEKDALETERNEPKDEIRTDLWKLEAKLKQTYDRMCVCFLQNIPLACIQSYFLFVSDVWTYGEVYLIDVVRLVYIATTVIDTALTASLYELYTHCHMVQLYKIAKAIRPKGYIHKPGKFSFQRTFFVQFYMIATWMYTVTALTITSGYDDVLAYVLSRFVINYTILHFSLVFENPYVNPPHGVHTTRTFWTILLINSVSCVGTQLDNSLNVLSFKGRRLFRMIYLRITNVLLLFIYHQNLVIGGMIYLHVYVYGSEDAKSDWYLTSLVIIFVLNCIPQFITKSDEEWFEAPYPVLTGCAFYTVLFDNVLNHSTDKLVRFRELMVTSMCLGSRLCRYYRKLMSNRDAAIKLITEELISVIDSEMDESELIEGIDEVREACLEDSFPFLHEFDCMRKLILENEDEVQRVQDLKLFYEFYGRFDEVFEYLRSEQIVMIFGVMGVPVGKDVGGVYNREWVFV